MAIPGTESLELLTDAGAVLQPGFVGLSAPEWLRRRLGSGELGGVALFGRNIRTPQQVAALTAEMYALNPDLLVATDEEGGDVTRLEVTSGSSYPGNLALGEVDDPDLTRRVARSIGLDLASVGINLDYAPDADVNSNPDNPVIGVRSFGADGDLAARHTAAYVRGLQSAGVAACAKHFPGHGDTSGDSHLGLPRIDLTPEQVQEHLKPFRAAIAADVKAIMTAHILFPAYDGALPATMSREILTGLLREELGYRGLIVTDGIEMGAISGTHGVAAGSVRAIAAGADTICVGGGLDDEAAFLYLRDALVWAVREGRLPAERLHEAAERNRAVARWSAAERRAQAGAHGEVGIGLTAARRALRIHGELRPVRGVPHVVEFAPGANIAVGDDTPGGVRSAGRTRPRHHARPDRRPGDPHGGLRPAARPGGRRGGRRGRRPAAGGGRRPAAGGRGARRAPAPVDAAGRAGPGHRPPGRRGGGDRHRARPRRHLRGPRGDRAGHPRRRPGLRGGRGGGAGRTVAGGRAGLTGAHDARGGRGRPRPPRCSVPGGCRRRRPPAGPA
ncbi:hypothetical protein GCM10025734_53550 [Kitasatospora paranensis]